MKLEKCPDKNARLSLKLMLSPQDSHSQPRKPEKPSKNGSAEQKKPIKSPRKESESGSGSSYSESSSSSSSRDFETKSDNAAVKGRKSKLSSVQKALNNTVLQEPRKARLSIDKKVPTPEEKEVEIGLFQDVRRKGLIFAGKSLNNVVFRLPNRANSDETARKPKSFLKPEIALGLWT